MAFVAYWADSGEIVGASGPYIGRTQRKDFWFFGFGPRTVGGSGDCAASELAFERGLEPITADADFVDLWL